MELKDYREKMDAIDDQLLPLFLQRMEVAAEIAAWKKANGIPVLDAGRERAKLRELEEKTPEALRDYTDSLYQTIFELSRSSQTRLLGVTSPRRRRSSSARRKPSLVFVRILSRCRVSSF